MTSQDIVKKLGASPASRQWDVIGIEQHHGIAIPLFSIHTKNSCGIGEYPDLVPLIDWCSEVGFDVLQLLPLNDTGPETSPYSALSAFALNPLHLGLTQLPNAMKDELLRKYAAELQNLTLISNRINYKAVQEKKDLFLRRYYQTYGNAIKTRADYLEFKKNNKFWLNDYAIFKSLKIRLNWAPWEKWPAIYKDPAPSFFETPPLIVQQEMEYHIFLQYLCFLQFQDVQKHAEMKHVFLKGDIPILINRESADVWRHRNLFLLQYAAGAPPDMYSKLGQKWGFPLYNWNAMAADDYRWWIARLNVAAQLYHIYRIDHIVGFFRIWGIPIAAAAVDGRFYPDDRNTWIPHGDAIMKVMLKNCDMLPIGEDLGTVPPEVRVYLRSIGICGTKVMRWERRWEEDKGFIDPKDYPPESMTTVSTHDSETLGQWWTNQKEEAKLYAETMGWDYAPEITQEQRFAIIRASHHSNSLFHINLLPEYLTLIPEMTWHNPEDERINIPGIIADRNWSYSLRPSLEELTANPALKQNIQKLLN